MKALIYKNTSTTTNGLTEDFVTRFPYGYAYETETHFVHFYGLGQNWFGIQTGMTVVEGRNGTLLDWVEMRFGATMINPMNTEIGESVDGVWRPGLYYYDQVDQALNIADDERRLAEQALRVLFEKLDDILLYIEPDPNSFMVHSHKIRELLILACTEVENFWMHYIRKAAHKPVNGKNYTTKDYVKLLNKLFLAEYECFFKMYPHLPVIKPFAFWEPANPTTSLDWYDAYNKTKHDRTGHFVNANLYNTIQSVAAVGILYVVRFSPFPMQEQFGTFNTLVNQHFKFRLNNPDLKSIYVPLLKIPAHYRRDIFSYNSSTSGDVQPYKINNFWL